MPELHAKLGPSSAERWMTCPGSVVLSEGIPSKSSANADEGTQAHELAEHVLLGKAFKGANPDMLINLAVYIDHVKELASAFPDNKMFIEKKVVVTDNLWGTADAIVWEPSTGTLYVRDLKYGAGVGVEVAGNLQLKIYALAALLTMKFPAKLVNVGIVQPRFNHPEGPIRSKDFGAVDLLDFHADLMDGVKRAWLAEQSAINRGNKASSWDEAFLHPSEKACRWCPAAPTCPKLKAKSKELVKLAFAPGLAYEPKQLAEALDYAPILEGWIKNLREFAYAEAGKGNPIPGYKLVEKRATRKWRDETHTAAHLLEDFQLGEHDVFEQKLLTPAAIEKLLPKDKKHLLDQLCIKESSGHTLAHESDKRDAIRVDAKAAFA